MRNWGSLVYHTKTMYGPRDVLVPWSSVLRGLENFTGFTAVFRLGLVVFRAAGRDACVL